MNLGKKTKIVCTIGPATESEEKLTQLVNEGMNVVRLNFSHGDFAEHQLRVDNIRRVMKQTGKVVAILQDLCGPKIRIGTFKNNMIVLKEGQEFILTTEECEGDESRVHVNYCDLPLEVKPGATIMLHDGSKKLEVTAIIGKDIYTKVIIGGKLSNNKGVNVPGANLSISALTAKDRKDVEFAINNKLDFVGLSFVRKAEDIRELRSILDKAGSKARIIAKIETPEAIINFDTILEEADAIMVARGDLAIEIPAEEVPIVQKLIINKCKAAGVPVIIATQLLESMIKNPVPTRAEVSDIANAIIDGTDAIMLSEETTLGDFPVEAVETMTRVALRLEREAELQERIPDHVDYHDITDVVSRAAVRSARSVAAELIVALTRSGGTARMIARHRPAQSVLALTDSAEHANKMILSYGCYPMQVPTFRSVDEIMTIVRKATLDTKLANPGDKVVIVGGMPLGTSAETNLILVETL